VNKLGAALVTVILLSGVARADEPRRSTLSGVAVLPGHLVAELNCWTIHGALSCGKPVPAAPSIALDQDPPAFRRWWLIAIGGPDHLGTDLTVRRPPERESVALALPTVNIAVELATGGGQVR
jgi:hypothetical protein